MSSNGLHAELRGGQIVVVDWRGDALPNEPNKRRPAVVIDDRTLFAPGYRNVIVVPLTDDAGLVIRSLSVPILPTVENGCTKPCWAAAHLVMTASKMRVRPTSSAVTADQLAAIRHQVAIAIGA
jgi:mRNA-degrading endonuclease toxin of MazEF toxin-antitoxin module